ncbi:acyl-CoA dehydratase activase-related protein, partial [uncultured Slackia sp.]|uniref:acyl-CoA dehydratase activase-related protein n=1 Tax=uncultured Slackia sp. TaxID=665903 RepID=UPI002609C3C2
MTPKEPMPPSPYADIRTVGIPRALMFYRYETLWTSFFEAIGVRVVTSKPSERALLERGDALSMDECCLASKLYMGHADSLMDECDAIFVPSLANLGRFKSFCTKFQALPDLVRNTFCDTSPRIVSCLVEEQESSTSMQDALIEMGMKFGCTKHDAKRAWKAARKASKNERKNKEHAFDAKLDELRRRKKKAEASSDEKAPLAILVVAHPYVAKDPLMGKGIVDALEELGATVLFAQDFDREKALEKSFEFSATLP